MGPGDEGVKILTYCRFHQRHAKPMQGGEVEEEWGGGCGGGGGEEVDVALG